MSNLDVLCIGDVVTDAFIKLRDENGHIYNNEDGKFLSIPFGAKIPYDHDVIQEADGNAPNAAVSFARLGLDSGIMSNVGHDQRGRDIIMTLQKSKVDTRYIHINPGKKSNYNYILWYKEERTILVNHEDYDYHWPHIHKSDTPKWIYFSSLSKKSLPFHDDLTGWLEENPDVNLAFSPGTFQIEEGAQRLKKLYKHANILILNRQEAAKVGGGKIENVHDLFDKLHALGPKLVVITDGPKGSYASGPEGRLFMPIYPDPSPPVERTGAGDAFSSTFVAAIIKGESVADAMRWGPVNSMNVVQHVGPHDGLLTETQLEALLGKAPDWYHASPF